jgi:hypothetical protein
MARSMTVAAETFPIAGRFIIARGARTEAVVVVATLREEGAVGRGECVPYARYGETVEGVVAAIEAMRPQIEAGLDRAALQDAMPPGAARNALDCALWDLDAKAVRRAGPCRGRDRPPAPVTTAYTISLDAPENDGGGGAQGRRPADPERSSSARPEGDIDRIRRCGPPRRTRP